MDQGHVVTSTFSCIGEIVQAAVGFGAAIPTCDDGTQYAEVHLVLRRAAHL